jgi:hypothetical protein
LSIVGSSILPPVEERGTVGLASVTAAKLVKLLVARYRSS